MTTELIPAATGSAPAAPTNERRYVSIFEDPSRFAEQINIADALSRTQFVPQAFRGKPEDCLVALDLACRFELQPLAVFPELYVIDNKATFSSKFLIALVNRSGRFSRIQFDEGVDGEVVAHCTEWKKNGARGEKDEWEETFPNYYAVARFVEKSTGEEFESPRVDMRFAEKNGWIVKPGSKWRTMPEIMCRYRAASILIKSVCPEIIAGLEFSEDVQDAREIEAVVRTPERERVPRSEPPRQIEKAPEFPTDAALAFAKRLDAAQSVAALDSIGAEIASAGLHAKEVGDLRARYARRKMELAKKEAPVSTFDKLAATIRDVTEPDALASLVDVIDAAAISNAEKLELKQRIEARAVDFEVSQ